MRCWRWRRSSRWWPAFPCWSWAHCDLGSTSKGFPIWRCAGRFDEALSRGEAYLQSAPDDPRALLMLAEVALARPAADPDKALGYLGRIRPDSPAMAAWVLVDRGNAQVALGRFDRAELCWNEALRTAPEVLESGRRRLDLLGLQGRLAEARALGLRLFEREPSPAERLKLLLRLARLDVDPPEPWSIVNKFEPAVRARTSDLPTIVACGLALVTVSRFEEGLTMLRQAVEHQPDSPPGWDALLEGLELASRREELAEVLARLPAPLSGDVRFARHRGWLAAGGGAMARGGRRLSPGLGGRPHQRRGLPAQSHAQARRRCLGGRALRPCRSGLSRRVQTNTRFDRGGRRCG